MSNGYFNISTELDKNDVKVLKNRLDEIAGVTSLDYISHNKNLAVGFDSRKTDFLKIKRKIENSGYDINYAKYEPNFK